MNTLLLAFSLATAPVADTVIVNGKFWTGNPKQPEAAAIAIKDGRILAVGSQEEINALKGPNTQTIELRGQRVVPGFYDSHLHLLGGGRFLSQVDLKMCKDEAEFGKLLKDYDAKLPKGRWLLGGNWDHDRAFNGILPTASLLDKYVPDRPVFINRYDGHMALANSAAMKLAGIDEKTKDIPGGVIFKDANGKPTGVLKDNATTLVEKHIPEPGRAEIVEAMDAAFKALAESGITSAQDMEGSTTAARTLYREILMERDRRGQLTARISVHQPIADHDLHGKLPRYRSDWLRFDGVKGFMDGSLGSSTAKMFEPYVNDPKNRGVFVTEPAVMRNLVMIAAKCGAIVAVHAIGDEANASLLDLYSDIGDSKAGFRIEHAQHLRPADIARFKKLNVIASMQPYHVIDDGRWAEGRIGVKRCESSYAYRSLIDSGATLAFGSDWPVAPLNVFEGIDAAVNRRPLDGKHPGGWFPAQRISVAEALAAYTSGSAYAGQVEKDRGTLEVGKLADLIVLNMDILDPAKKDDIAKVKVMETIVNGKTVYPAPERRR